MMSTARKVSREDIQQGLGRVVSVKGNALQVRLDGFDCSARRAVSCLVEPLVDDLVLTAVASSGAVWVLAVLEREDGAPATLGTEGDLTIRQRHGRLTIAAQEGIELLSAKDLSLLGRALKVTADEGSVIVQKLGFVGGLLRAEIDKVKIAATTFDAVLDRFSQRVRSSFRTVSESDQLRAERIDYTAKSTMSLHGENALITAEQLVKVDGEQIHLG